MNWLDSWDDWCNPITIRELRTHTFLFGFEVSTLLFLFILTVADIVILCTMKSKQDLVWLSVIPCLLSQLTILTGFDVLASLQNARCEDDLLSTVPLSPQQQVHGYWAASCIKSLFLNSLCLPFIAIGQLVYSVSYVLLLVPLGSFLLTQMITLILLSFAARIKHEKELQLLGITVFLYPILIAVPWFCIIYFSVSWGEAFIRNHMINLFWFGVLSLFILLPIALLLLGYIAYRLTVYGFRTWRKPLWHALLLNMVVYMLFDVIMATLWFALAVLVL
jgi:hypothetical protein